MTHDDSRSSALKITVCPVPLVCFHWLSDCSTLTSRHLETLGRLWMTTYPIANQCRGAMEAMQNHLYVNPPPFYRPQNPSDFDPLNPELHHIKPEDWVSTLRGAIVACHFSLSHMPWDRTAESHFTTTLQDLVVLEPPRTLGRE